METESGIDSDSERTATARLLDCLDVITFELQRRAADDVQAPIVDVT
jgi:hypothetical protein